MRGKWDKSTNIKWIIRNMETNPKTFKIIADTPIAYSNNFEFRNP